jgi:hypothetical protein
MFQLKTPVCTDNMVYRCLGCPSTCKDYRRKTCVEPDECNYGCGCPDGEVMNEENNCTKIVNCPCYNENGVIIHENFTFLKEGSKCKEWLVSNYTFLPHSSLLRLDNHTHNYIHLVLHKFSSYNLCRCWDSPNICIPYYQYTLVLLK